MPRPTPESWTDARVVVVVAHPDDEVLGCGALLATLRDVSIVHVTDGAPRQGSDGARQGFATPAAYAAARRAEAIAALAVAGVAATCLTSLGFADQGAAGRLVQIARELVARIEGADLVLTHAYEGGHCDHDAVAFAVNAACRLGSAGASPELVEMPFYHGSADGWVRQRFLPPNAAGATETEMVLVLTPEQRERKARMLAEHATQRDTLASFALDAERFRRAPATNFTARPHDGALLYERHGWNLTWPVWESRVRAALATLGLVAA